MQLFYATKTEIQAGVMTAEESNHCVRVLRKNVGDNIHIIDGEGGVYTAVIKEAKPKACKFTIVDKTKKEYNLPNLHILIAPTKSMDRFEFFVEKACELGVREITPIIAYNSERKHLNVEKLRKKMVGACKQSYTLFFPIINEPIKFKEVVKMKAKQKLVAHCYSHETPHLNTFSTQEETVLLIGPEGDFSKEEVEVALSSGFEAISLGHKRLRTETAGIFACSIFNLGA